MHDNRQKKDDNVEKLLLSFNVDSHLLAYCFYDIPFFLRR